MRLFTITFAFISLVTCSNLTMAQEDQWVPIVKTLPDLLYDKGTDNVAFTNEIVSTDAVSWPDGRSSLVTLLKQSGNNSKINIDYVRYYRCVDHMTKGFQQNGHKCWALRGDLFE